MAIELSERWKKIGKYSLVALAVISVIVIIILSVSSDDESASDCIPPDPVTEGYDISNVTGSLNKDSFSITGVRCATGYTGTEPSAIVCGTAGGEYTLSGCSVSTQPVDGGDDGDINNCDSHEPDLTNSNMNAITTDSCDGTAIGGTCGHTCDGGHTGGSVTCQADGTWAVVPCTLSATTCSDNPCGTGATCTDNADGTGYTCSCNVGYWGTTTTNAAAACTEKTCANTDGAQAPTAASCGTGASCTEGGSGDGYTCTCDVGYWGTTTTNAAAACTEKTCANTDGAQPPTAAICGQDATCAEGGTGDGYTCSCNAGFYGDSTNNAPANCTGPPFCSERANLCSSSLGYSSTGQVSSTARCATQNCDSTLDLQACCSEWNCRVPTLDETPGYQVTLPGVAERPSEVPYSQVNQLVIQCSGGYMTSGSSVPSASVCSGDGLNIQLSGCITGGGVAEVTSVVESPGEWYVGGGNSASEVEDRKDCHSFCAARNKVCSENTTAEKFSSEANLAEFLNGLNVQGLYAQPVSRYQTVLGELAADAQSSCSGSEQQYDTGIEDLASTGANSGAKFYIGSNTCFRKLYSGANPDDLIPLSCGEGHARETPYQINVCKCRDP